MKKMMTSVDLGEGGKMIYIDPSKQARVTLLKVPRKLKKKIKKEGSWGMPVMVVSGNVSNWDLRVGEPILNVSQILEKSSHEEKQRRALRLAEGKRSQAN